MVLRRLIKRAAEETAITKITLIVIALGKIGNPTLEPWEFA
jgi:hypothetical protein